MVAQIKKNEMHRFLRQLTADRGTKSQLAQVYYDQGIIGLVGRIDKLVLPGPKRIAVMTTMIETLPPPSLPEIAWLSHNHPYFRVVTEICDAFFRRWASLPQLLKAIAEFQGEAK